MKTHWLGLLVMLVLLAGAVVAQDTVDPDAAPLFATVNLTAGEELDPFIVSVTATGTIDATTVAEGCLGFIPDEPDVVLNWSGTGELLRIFFYSLGDATLTIVTPDGDVLCNDDVNATLLDPMVDIENPAEGRYAIYVGHFELEASFPGFLAITQSTTYHPAQFDLELLMPRDPIAEEETASQLPIDILLIDNPPLSGAVVDLAPGFDSEVLDFTESGQIPLFNVQTGNSACTGFVESLPTAVVNWSGEAEQIRLFVESEADTTLLVHTPAGDYLCTDDTASGGENLNPSLTVDTPDQGRYVIYVGAFEPGEEVAGTLTITEDLNAAPTPLTFDDIIGDQE